MASISDAIEQFLLKVLEDECSVIISRNELANYFACAPSQINYVLSTRFTTEKGYLIESKRGGGGSITLIRLPASPECLLQKILSLDPRQGLSYQRAVAIVERMHREGLITEREADLMSASLSDKALLAPSIAKGGLRVSILKSYAAELLRPREK